MADLSVNNESSSETPPEARDSGRKPWSAPRMRSLRTSAAENGPTFPTADGIEGQS